MATVASFPSNISPPDEALSDDALFEIVDGRHVEKVMGTREVGLANLLARLIWNSLGSEPAGEPFVEMLFRVQPGDRCGPAA